MECISRWTPPGTVQLPGRHTEHLRVTGPASWGREACVCQSPSSGMAPPQQPQPPSVVRSSSWAATWQLPGATEKRATRYSSSTYSLKKKNHFPFWPQFLHEILIRGHFFTLDKMISSHDHCTLFLFGVLGTRVVPGRVGGGCLPIWPWRVCGEAAPCFNFILFSHL